MSDSNPPRDVDPLETLLDGLGRLLAGREAPGGDLAALVASLAEALGASSVALHTLAPDDPAAALSAPDASWHRPGRAPAPLAGDTVLALLERGGSGEGAAAVHVAPVIAADGRRRVLVLAAADDAPPWSERDERRLRAAARRRRGRRRGCRPASRRGRPPAS